MRRRYRPNVDRLRLGERTRRRVQRDRDRLRTESQQVGWAAWFVAWCLYIVVGLAVLGLLAALGRPMWGLASSLIGVMGGFGLVRLYLRRKRG